MIANYSEFKFKLVRHYDRNMVDVHLFTYWNSGDTGGSYYHTITKGLLTRHKKEEAVYFGDIKPLMSLPFEALKTLPDALLSIGLEQNINEAERITSNAVADERKEEISWLRAEITKQLDKI